MKCRECGNNILYHKLDCSIGRLRKYCDECYEKLAKIGSKYCSEGCHVKARRLNGL